MMITSFTGRKRVNSDEDDRPTKVAKLEGIKAAQTPFSDGRNTGRKRVNSDEDNRPTKVAKLEGIKAAQTPFSVGRNTGDKAEETASDDEVNKLNRVLEEDLKKPNDGEQDTQTGDKSATKEVLSDTKLNTLRQMFKGDLKNLDEKDQYHIIQCMPIEEISSLALESGQRKGSDEERIAPRSMPCFGEILRIIECMEHNPEKVKKAEFCLLYDKLHYKDFAIVAQLALNSNQERCLDSKMEEFESDSDPCLLEEDIFKLLNPLSSEQLATIPALCRVLPPILFDHVFFGMSKIHLFGSTLEESDEDCPAPVPVISNERAEESDEEYFDESDMEYFGEVSENYEEECKEAAEECPICLGKGTHTGPSGFYCSYEAFVPKGAVVGPGYCVVCRNCGRENEHPVDVCWSCGWEGGQAIADPEPIYFF